MIELTILANGPTDPGKGWSGPWALFFAAVVCYLIWRGDAWWRARQAPSPTETGTPAPREISQARRVSSQVSRDETPGETDESQWYGSIQKVRGQLVRVYRNTSHVAKTGNSPRSPKPQAYGDEVGDTDVPDDELDIALEIASPAADHRGRPVPDDVIDDAADDLGDDGLGDDDWIPNDDEAGQRKRVLESREEYIGRCFDANVSKADIVKALQEYYGRSRAQAYRDVDTAPQRRKAA